MATAKTKTVKKQINQIPDIFIGGTFEEIKTDLIDWLGGQEEFKDYDFSGSRMNVLIDLLSYATLYIQQMGNTALFESFIRTAALRVLLYSLLKNWDICQIRARLQVQQL